MGERDMEKEEQNGKRKGWGIEKKMLYIFRIVIPLDRTVCRNRKALSTVFETTDSSNNKMMLQACLSKNVKFIGDWSLLFLVNRYSFNFTF
jgi:hypothetical protein